MNGCVILPFIFILLIIIRGGYIFPVIIQAILDKGQNYWVIHRWSWIYIRFCLEETERERVVNPDRNLPFLWINSVALVRRKSILVAWFARIFFYSRIKKQIQNSFFVIKIFSFNICKNINRKYWSREYFHIFASNEIYIYIYMYNLNETGMKQVERDPKETKRGVF